MTTKNLIKLLLKLDPKQTAILEFTNLEYSFNNLVEGQKTGKRLELLLEND